MTTRREAIGIIGSITATTMFTAPRSGLASVNALQGESTPPLAPGAPASPERMALIDAFRAKAEGIERQFEARAHKSDWVMPYRLFRPRATGKLPLVMYLHGGGGLGDDNEKQMATGNIFGTRVWALEEHQRSFPCYVVVPQTDRGWVPPALAVAGETPRVQPGLGDGARLALEIIDELRREFAIDEQRIYLAGQSMGGGGAWHMTAQRPRLFAAAVICCGTATAEDATASLGTPLWNFHGDADETVNVAGSRVRIAALRKAGGRPLYTEYAGVGHNVWLWAFTEPALVRWVFSHRRTR